MYSLKTGWLTINPVNHQWNLHISSLSPHKERWVTARLGSEKRKKKIYLTSKQPPYDAIKTKVFYTVEEGQLSIGPLIGILTIRNGQSFRGRRKDYSEIIRTAQKLGGLVYVFTAENIDWENGTSLSYLYDGYRRKWISAQLPLPDVVYNRIPYREDEARPEIQETLAKLQAKKNLRLFNKHFFNKWQLYQCLYRDELLNDLLPESEMLTDSDILADMLTRHSFVYLKPVTGMAGDGIMKVMQMKNGMYQLIYRKSNESNEVVSRKYDDLSFLWKRIKKMASGQLYLIQQGIPLAEYAGNPFDVRLLVQKNRVGKWQVSGIGIRVAGKGKITTHVPRGGYIASPKEVFSEVFPHQDSAVLTEKIKKAALGIAASLDREFGPLGEISMDIGITPQEKLWFFEANAKPMKFDEPHIRKISLKRVVEYCQYLSRFSRNQEEINHGYQRINS